MSDKDIALLSVAFLLGTYLFWINRRVTTRCCWKEVKRKYTETHLIGIGFPFHAISINVCKNKWWMIGDIQNPCKIRTKTYKL